MNVRVPYLLLGLRHRFDTEQPTLLDLELVNNRDRPSTSSTGSASRTNSNSTTTQNRENISHANALSHSNIRYYLVFVDY